VNSECRPAPGGARRPSARCRIFQSAESPCRPGAVDVDNVVPLGRPDLRQEAWLQDVGMKVSHAAMIIAFSRSLGRSGRFARVDLIQCFALVMSLIHIRLPREGGWRRSILLLSPCAASARSPGHRYIARNRGSIPSAVARLMRSCEQPEGTGVRRSSQTELYRDRTENPLDHSGEEGGGDEGVGALRGGAHSGPLRSGRARAASR